MTLGDTRDDSPGSHERRGPRPSDMDTPSRKRAEPSPAAPRVYLDHNATTPMRAEARTEMLRVLEEFEGNPSSVHSSGRAARQQLDEARERCAGALGVHEDEIVFTSGGTESNNLALIGGLRARADAPGLVTTAVEHSSILSAAAHLEEVGHPVTRVGVDAEAFPESGRLIEAASAPDCGLLSIMTANNEVGSVLPVGEIVARLRESRPGERAPTVHTDAVQAPGRLPLDLRGWDVDLASFSAHKFAGPRGVGLLYRRARTPFASLLFGGEQEGGLRPGTENLAAICAASVALELACGEVAEGAPRQAELCRSFWSQLQVAVPGVRLLGPPIDSPARLPNTLAVRLPDVDGRVLVTRLDIEGLEASAGSACASGSIEPSHVLLAMGLSEEHARSGLRLSLGRTTGANDIRIAVDILRKTKTIPAHLVRNPSVEERS